MKAFFIIALFLVIGMLMFRCASLLGSIVFHFGDACRALLKHIRKARKN